MGTPLWVSVNLQRITTIVIPVCLPWQRSSTKMWSHLNQKLHQEQRFFPLRIHPRWDRRQKWKRIFASLKSAVLQMRRSKRDNCSARKCSSFRRKFMEWSIISPALSLLMKHLVIVQHQTAHNFSVFHWSQHGCLVSIGQHFVITRVVHLPKRTDTSLITEVDLITESDQAVRAVHSCNSWFRDNVQYYSFKTYVVTHH